MTGIIDKEHMDTQGEQQAGILDRNELVGRLMGNREIAQKMVSRFLSSVPQEIDLLESMIRIGDPKEIATLAHRHKGTAKTLAASRIAALSMQIERQSGDGAISNLLSLVDDLRVAHEQLQKELDHWVAEAADGACE